MVWLLWCNGDMVGIKIFLSRYNFIFFYDLIWRIAISFSQIWVPVSGSSLGKQLWSESPLLVLVPLHSQEFILWTFVARAFVY